MIKIISTKNIFGGKPRIAGTRISVDLIGDYINLGYGVDDIKKSYPHLTSEQILAALTYIKRRASSEITKLEPQIS